MKYMVRSQTYKATNVTFDPQVKAAFSYGWWQFVKVIKGRVVFNEYRYSVTTSKHQNKVKQLMSELGIRVDVYVQTRVSLKNIKTLKEVRALHNAEMQAQAAYREHKRLERNRRAKERRAVKRELERQRIEQRPHLTLVGGV